MKVKLLKKVRKEYKINYREKPYHSVLKREITRDENNNSHQRLVYEFKNYQLKIPNRRFFLFRRKFDDIFLTIDCNSIDGAKEHIIQDLRIAYPNLGNYNRQRKIKEQEHKVWYNGI